jgi:hypothetical protein
MQIQGVYIAGNEWWNPGPDTIIVNDSAVAITDVTDVTIDGNLAGYKATTLRSVTATKTVVATTPTSTFTVDFSDVLLFDTSKVPIQSVQFSLMTNWTPIPSAVARIPTNSTVTIETNVAISGTVIITVDQSQRSA